uniref:SRP54-type proteins GTP-binding domain-containing protein n=1 Tax=Rhodosorus marinus TaxID=101924 RepID=A0A7S2ZVK9_9RHOD|mmetsp:Transcript_31182/g.119947  ORF Transcript_31182/g.119947 Transcript_31182/m.119947 type:complete len:266 (+) Transcript_31182:244-1041(+)
MMEDKLAFICGGIASQARRKLRDGGCFGLPPNRGRVRPRTATVVAVFDFLKQGQKAVEESGQSIVDYVKKRAEEDIAKVNAFNDGLQKSRERLAQDLSAILGSITTDAELEEALENIEEVLITSDLGMDTVDIVMDDLRAEATKERLRTEEDIKATLKGTLVRVLNEKGGSAPLSVGSEAPTVVVFVGANGMGKTTTVGKLGTRYKKEGKKVLLAACDTFRAAAVEQLATWADRAEVDIVKPLEGAKKSFEYGVPSREKGSGGGL